MKTTLVIGASTNKERYSNKCIRLLTEHKIKTYALGNREGNVYTIDIETGFPHFENINTVAVYLSPKNQEKYIDYLISLKPQRILFPPGTENPEELAIRLLTYYRSSLFHLCAAQQLGVIQNRRSVG